MDRLILFRVWDLENEMMVYSPHSFYYDNVDKCHYYYDTWADENDGRKIRCKVMQFIGKFDINKKEIYESDNVKFKPCGDMSLNKALREEEIISTIIWDDVMAKFDVKWCGMMEYHLEFPSFEMEIVGNIYEDNKNSKD